MPRVPSAKHAMPVFLVLCVRSPDPSSTRVTMACHFPLFFLTEPFPHMRKLLLSCSTFDMTLPKTPFDSRWAILPAETQMQWILGAPESPENQRLHNEFVSRIITKCRNPRLPALIYICGNCLHPLVACVIIKKTQVEPKIGVWGSRGRWFESSRPDQKFAGQAPSV